MKQVVETTAPPRLPPADLSMGTGPPDQAGSKKIKASDWHRFIFGVPKRGSRQHRDFGAAYKAFDGSCYSSLSASIDWS